MKDPLVHLSVIIPMLNEAESLPQRLAHWQTLIASGVEVLVVDGGSSDDSRQLVQAAGFPVIVSERGRARQMNRGAAAAQGELLLFLHADTELPAGAIHSLLQSLTQSKKLWGRFDVQIEGRALMFPVISTMINLRSRLSGIATGDQAIFIRRDLFQKLGGFPDQALMEDIEICKRMRRLSRPLCLRSRVKTSGRRWEKRGVWRTIFLMWRLRWAYWRGVPAQELAKAYR